MMQEDEYVQILMRLGLTFLQAKTYLSLVKFEKADVKTIFKVSKIARQDIYRVMPTLEKMGLAQEIIGKPTMFKATPMKQGFRILLQNKTQKHVELEKKAKDLIKNLEEPDSKQTPQDEHPQFIINYSEDLMVKWLDKVMSSTQYSLDIICKWKLVRYRILSDVEELQEMFNRNVKLRLITEKQDNLNFIQKIMGTLGYNPSFEIRFVSQRTPVDMIISDGREANLCIGPPMNNRITPSLASSHPQFLKVMVGYFDAVWEKTTVENKILARQALAH
jgi:sugar-specific transcriptional regulator TrmB